MADVIYVNRTASGANNGTSWANAFTSLSAALSVAGNGDEIWVAKGTYKPEVAVDINGDGVIDPRERTFRIPNGVKLYGGFNGTEASREERDWLVNPTVLSGDIDNNDKLTNGVVSSVDDIVGSNAYHVIYTINVSSSTRLDGFVINAGNADPPPSPSALTDPNECGGGWYNAPAPASSPTLANNTFLANYARSGGGFFSAQSATSTGEMVSLIYHCNFRYNEADVSGGGMAIQGGPGMHVAPVIRGGEFYANTVWSSGGAIHMSRDYAVIDTVRFIANKTTIVTEDTGPGSGGAVYLSQSNAAFSTCFFAYNVATGNPTDPAEGGGGGALYIDTSPFKFEFDVSQPRFFNCGFYANAVYGNGGGGGGAVVHYSGSGILLPQYVNCVFSHNSAIDGGGAVANSYYGLSEPPEGYTPALEPEFVNCTFSKNFVGSSDVPFQSSGTLVGVDALKVKVVNSIVTSTELPINAKDLISYSYSLVQGSGGSGASWNSQFGIDDGHNIDAIPFFKNANVPLGADNVLGTMDDGLQLEIGSPCLNTGNSNVPGLAGVSIDIKGAPRIQAYSVDMGAYEATGIILYPIFLLTPWDKIPIDGCLTCPWGIKFGDEFFDNFTWNGPAQFIDYGDHGEILGTIVSTRNSEISFDVYIKLVEPRTWAEWNRMGRSWLVYTPESQRIALKSHEQWKYWQLSSDSYLSGIGEVTGTLRLRHAPEGYYTGFQMGDGANGYDADFGISGGFFYEGELRIGRERRFLQGVGSLNSDAELCERDCIPLTSPETFDGYDERTDRTSFVFPNPAREKIEIHVQQMEGTFLVKLYSQDGQLRQSEQTMGDGGVVSLSLRNHMPGMYYLQVIAPSGERKSQTIIIE
jgi:hypothetical protein